MPNAPCPSSTPEPDSQTPLLLLDIEARLLLSYNRYTCRRALEAADEFVAQVREQQRHEWQDRLNALRVVP